MKNKKFEIQDFLIKKHKFVYLNEKFILCSPFIN